MGTCQNRISEAVLTCTNNLCFEQKYENNKNQRTNGPVNADLISWPRISICLAKVKGTSYTFIHSFN